MLYFIFLFRDILNELRRLKLISQSLTNTYTILQCQELKSSTPDIQTIFIFYMIIKLLRKEGYIDEDNLRKEPNRENFKNILRNGFLTTEQILQSIKDFFLQDVRRKSTKF